MRTTFTSSRPVSNDLDHWCICLYSQTKAINSEGEGRGYSWIQQIIYHGLSACFGAIFRAFVVNCSVSSHSTRAFVVQSFLSFYFCEYGINLPLTFIKVSGWSALCAFLFLVLSNGYQFLKKVLTNIKRFKAHDQQTALLGRNEIHSPIR